MMSRFPIPEKVKVPPAPAEPPSEEAMRLCYPAWQVDVWLRLREGYGETGGDRFSSAELMRLDFCRWLFDGQLEEVRHA